MKKMRRIQAMKSLDSITSLRVYFLSVLRVNGCRVGFRFQGVHVCQASSFVRIRCG